MTSGITRLARIAALLLAPALAPTLATAAEFDLPALLARIAQPAAATVPFVEVRFSRLLKAPLAVSGTLEHGTDGALIRRVQAPYSERTEVRGNDVVVTRAGAQPRRFALDRAPELQGLLGSIDAMLRGDGDRLQRYFTPTLDGAPAAWRVHLVPKDERLRQRLADITVYGREAAARCFVMSQSSGAASIIALGATRPDDVPLASREALEAWCRGPRT